MLIQLDYSGHYPRKLVEVSEEEYARIRELEKGHYLWDTPDKQGLWCDIFPPRT